MGGCKYAHSGKHAWVNSIHIHKHTHTKPVFPDKTLVLCTERDSDQQGCKATESKKY